MAVVTPLNNPGGPEGDTVTMPYPLQSPKGNDGGRQRNTSCPLLYRYRLTHTYCSLARLPPTHPFVGAPILQRHFQVPWHARVPSPRVLLPHTYTQDGWFLQPERRPARLPRRAIFSRCICRCSRLRARPLPPASSSLTHARRMDGFCNQNADQLGSLAGPSLLSVYVGVVECAPASPCTYSSSSDWRTVFKEFASQSLHNRFFF